MAEPVEIRFFAATHPTPAPRNLAFERIVWARRVELGRYDFLRADRELVRQLVRGEILGRT
jgi:hypothetical protein